jgi:hypothetical protein
VSKCKFSVAINVFVLGYKDGTEKRSGKSPVYGILYTILLVFKKRYTCKEEEFTAGPGSDMIFNHVDPP